LDSIKAPSKQQLKGLTEDLKWARDAAVETCRWVSTFTFPDFQRDYEFVALRHPDEYPLNEGRLVSARGSIFHPEYEQHFAEEHRKPFLYALHSVLLDARLLLCWPAGRLQFEFR